MCLFCKIVNKQIKADIVWEDSEILAFKDIHPLAPIHILIIPKKHFNSINDFKSDDALLAGKMIIVAKDIAEKSHTGENGYKLLFRVGKNGGQEIEHIHLHLLGGAKLSENIHPIIVSDN